MTLRQQPAVGVERIPASETDLAVTDPLSPTPGRAETERLELQQNDVGEAVVDLEEIGVLSPDTGHRQRLRCGEAETNAKQVGATGDVVGRVGVSFGDAEHDHGHVDKVARPLGRGHDDGRTAVRLERAVIETERLGDKASRQVVLHRQRTATHQCTFGQLRVGSACEGDLTGIGVERPVLQLVAHSEPCVVLNGGHRPVRAVEIASRVDRRGDQHRMARTGGAGLGPEGRVAVPPGHHEHVIGQPGRNGEGGALERGDRAGAPHHHRRGEAKVLDPEIGGQLFGRRVAGRRHETVDVSDGESGVGHRLASRIEHQSDRRPVAATHVRGLADPDDRRPAAEVHVRHSPIFTRMAREA